jgi:hypothetical protein
MTLDAKLGMQFQDRIDNYWNGYDMGLEDLTIEEEKQMLAALKLGYEDCCNNPGKWVGTYLTEEGFIKYLPRYKQLIDTVEEEVRQIEAGELVIQPDGTAIPVQAF